MYQFYDHGDLFHWLAMTRSYVINLFTYNFYNFDNWLVSALTSVGSTCSPSLDGNIWYFVGKNGCNP